MSLFRFLFIVLCTAASLPHSHATAFSDVSLVDGDVRRATEATNERKQQRVISRLLPHAWKHDNSSSESSAASCRMPENTTTTAAASHQPPHAWKHDAMPKCDATCTSSLGVRQPKRVVDAFAVAHYLHGKRLHSNTVTHVTVSPMRVYRNGEILNTWRQMSSPSPAVGACTVLSTDKYPRHGDNASLPSATSFVFGKLLQYFFFYIL